MLSESPSSRTAYRGRPRSERRPITVGTRSADQLQSRPVAVRAISDRQCRTPDERGVQAGDCPGNNDLLGNPSPAIAQHPR